MNSFVEWMENIGIIVVVVVVLSEIFCWVIDQNFDIVFRQV